MKFEFNDWMNLMQNNSNKKQNIPSIHLKKKRFINELNNVITDMIDDNIDDNGKMLPCKYSENDIYDIMMKTEDHRFLTIKFAEEMIYIFMHDFKKRMEILREYKLT